MRLSEGQSKRMRKRGLRDETAKMCTCLTTPPRPIPTLRYFDYVMTPAWKYVCEIRKAAAAAAAAAMANGNVIEARSLTYKRVTIHGKEIESTANFEFKEFSINTNFFQSRVCWRQRQPYLASEKVLLFLTKRIKKSL